jgi:hypothetical protein
VYDLFEWSSLLHDLYDEIGSILTKSTSFYYDPFMHRLATPPSQPTLFVQSPSSTQLKTPSKLMTLLQANSPWSRNVTQDYREAYAFYKERYGLDFNVSGQGTQYGFGPDGVTPVAVVRPVRATAGALVGALFTPDSVSPASEPF